MLIWYFRFWAIRNFPLFKYHLTLMQLVFGLLFFQNRLKLDRCPRIKVTILHKPWVKACFLFTFRYNSLWFSSFWCLGYKNYIYILLRTMIFQNSVILALTWTFFSVRFSRYKILGCKRILTWFGLWNIWRSILTFLLIKTWWTHCIIKLFFWVLFLYFIYKIIYVIFVFQRYFVAFDTCVLLGVLPLFLLQFWRFFNYSCDPICLKMLKDPLINQACFIIWFYYWLGFLL